MYVAGKRANVQVLTILDVYSRWNMGQYINWSIRANDVIALFDEIFQNYQMPKHFIVRNDNGDTGATIRFEAYIVQQYMRYKGVIQEFTLPATPKQNARGRLVTLRLTTQLWKMLFARDLNLKI